MRSESGIKQLNPVAPISDTLTNWGNGSHETKTRAPSATESPMLGLAVIIKESPSMKKTVSWYSTTRGGSNMAKHHNCEGCVYLKFPFGSSEFKEHCVGCQVADVEAMINSLLPFGIEPVYQRTNYLVDKGEK